MSRYTRVELTTEDFDWFGLDEAGFVGHFTNNGTIAVPVEIVTAKEDLQRALDWFDRQRRVTGNFVVSPKIENWVPWLRVAPQKRKEIYLEVSAEWSERGLYSFDIGNKGGGPSTPYFLVTKPKRPMNERELPRDLREYLGRVRLPVLFGQVDVVTVSYDPEPE